MIYIYIYFKTMFSLFRVKINLGKYFCALSLPCHK